MQVNAAVLHCHKAGIIQVIEPLSLFDWYLTTVPLHARSAWQGQTEVVIANIS